MMTKIVNKLVPIVLAVAACLLVTSAKLEIKEKSLPCERLPTNVVPTKYELQLEFPLTDVDTYRGQVDISLRFPYKNHPDYKELIKGLEGETCNREDFGSTTIVLHADPSIELEDIKVVTESSGLLDGFGEGDRNRVLRSVKRDSKKQLLAIELWRGMDAGGSGVLSIKFAGRLRNDKRGVYKSRYNDAAHSYEHIVSQFQPTDARLVFPVFDEPRFKAPFKVRIMHPSGYTALSNTEVELTTELLSVSMTETTFKQTPAMAVHMLAFTVGHFDQPLEVEAKSAFGRHKYKVRVFTAPGLRNSGQFALEVAQLSLENFEKYINYPYPLDKFDIVAIANHDKDNTESWGLSFIRDSLIWIDDETKPDTKITTAVNVAHVCVHQWFGNLVTAAWWNDLWITEGVAAQFAFNIVRELHPQFESEYFVRLATLSGVMQLDAPGDKHALSPPLDELRTSEQIYGLFDNIEFMKSASLAQTMNRWLDKKRANWYREVLRSLVRKFAHKNVNYADYLDAIKKYVEGPFWGGTIDYEDIVALLDSLKSVRGVPLINAKLHDDRYHVDVKLLATETRRTFHLKRKARNSVLLYDNLLIERGSVQDNNIFGQTFEPKRPFSDSWWDVDLKPKYVKMGANPDINTYYRVRYSEADYESLCEPISTREMSAMDRLQILDDANVLAQAHLIKSHTFKQLVDCFADEDNGAVLLQLMQALQTLASQKLSSPSSKAIENIFTKFGFATTGQETFLEQRSRSVGLKALIEQGNQQVSEAALEAFDKGPVALFLREPIYTAVVLNGSQAQVGQLEANLEMANSFEEKVRLASALSLSNDKKLLSNLQLWLTNKSFLNERVIRPIIDTIEPKMRPDKKRRS